MTRSEQIILKAGEAIRNKALTAKGGAAFTAWMLEMREQGIGYREISNLTNVGRNDLHGLFSSQQPGYEEYSGTALSQYIQGEHDWQSWWLEHCPIVYRANLLTEAVDDWSWLDAVFWETHGRRPAQRGRDYYLGQYQSGRSLGAIATEIERNSKR